MSTMFEAAVRRGAVPTNNPATPCARIAALFEPDVVAMELCGPGDVALLYPREAAYCSPFAAQRSAEFAAGRLCARRALAELGVVNFALEANADRSPRWPAKIVGSITHTTGFCAAVAARSDRLRSIGIDAETIGRVTPELHRLIFTADEAARLDGLDESQRVWEATIIFSAKEALYKCQYAITRAWRDFHDASVELRWSNRHGGEFIVHAVLGSAALDWGFELPAGGKFCIDGDLVLTGIASAAGA